MMTRISVILMTLLSESLACRSESPFHTGVVCRVTKPGALELKKQITQVIQAAFQHADFPDITGEKYMRFLGSVVYGLTNIHTNELTIANSEVVFKEGEAIEVEIQNMSVSFKGTLNYGYVGTWLVKLIHTIDFEIDSSIDLQITIKLTCEKERVTVDTSDCYVTFHKLILHLQGDKDPGWLKQLFTNFISFTLKLVLQNQMCKEINFVSQMLADFALDTATNILRDGDIGVDISLLSSPVIKANYFETYHKGLLLYKNYSDIFHDSAFTPSLLSESRMLCFWFADHILNNLALAAFLDKHLEFTITGEELEEMFESEELKSHQATMQEIFQGASYNDSLAKVWSLDPPQITFQPAGTIVTSSVAVELSVPSQGGETPSVALYFEKEVTTTIQASYVQKKLVLHLSDAVIKLKMLKCASNIAVDDETLRHFWEEITSVAGIPEVISRMELALTSLINSKGFDLLEIKDPEIITKKGYAVVQLDFGFPQHVLEDFLKRSL